MLESRKQCSNIIKDTEQKDIEHCFSDSAKQGSMFESKKYFKLMTFFMRIIPILSIAKFKK